MRSLVGSGRASTTHGECFGWYFVTAIAPATLLTSGRWYTMRGVTLMVGCECLKNDHNFLIQVPIRLRCGTQHMSFLFLHVSFLFDCINPCACITFQNTIIRSVWITPTSKLILRTFLRASIAVRNVSSDTGTWLKAQTETWMFESGTRNLKICRLHLIFFLALSKKTLPTLRKSPTLYVVQFCSYLLYLFSFLRRHDKQRNCGSFIKPYPRSILSLRSISSIPRTAASRPRQTWDRQVRDSQKWFPRHVSGPKPTNGAPSLLGASKNEVAFSIIAIAFSFKGV